MPSELSAEIAEGIEAEFMYHYVANASPSTRQDLGIAVTRFAGGVVMSVRRDESRYWSKALGLGFAEPVSADLIERVLEYYRAQGNSDAVIQLAPSVLPDEWDEIRVRHELTADATVIKLACPVADFRGGGCTDLKIDPVDPADIARWTEVVLDTFGMPMNLSAMITPGVHSPAFHPFAAWDGDEMVATANLLIRGEIASLNTGATLSEHRNRGAQSALIAARARHAARAGCRWLVAETEQPANGMHNPSLENLLRAGFNPLYSRINWTWRAGG